MIKLGNGDVDDLKLGNSQVDKAYLGDTQVFPSFSGNTPVAGVPLVSWYDASDATTITTNAFGVTQWDDKSGSPDFGTYLVIQNPSGAEHPQWTGSDTVEMNGSGMRSVIQPQKFNGCFNLFFVCEGLFAGSSSSHLYSRQTSPQIYCYGGDHKFNTFTITGSRFDRITPLTLVNIIHDGNQMKLYENGSQVGSTVTTIWTGDDNKPYVDFGGGAEIGGNGNANEAFNEIITSNDNSESNRQKFEGYLAHKWGLNGSLPVGHPYKGSPP